MNLVSLETINKLANQRTPEVDHIQYSKAKHKKYTAILKTGKRINFGDKRYSDFLIHKDKDRRARYRTRHKNDNISIPSPGRYSYYLLW